MKDIKLCLASLFLASVFCCNAQELVRWTDGPLTWDSFQRVDSSQTKPFYPFFTLAKENKSIKANGILYKYLDICAAIDAGQSWVRTGEDTAGNLQQIQREFDLLEHIAEEYRTDFLFYNDPETNEYEAYFGIDKKRNFSEMAYIERFNAALEKIGKDGKAGEYPVSREPFDITRVPYQIEKGSNDALFSLLGILPMGYLSDQFEPAICFRAGYAHREGNHILSAEFTFGRTEFEYTLPLFTPPIKYDVNGTYLAYMGRFGGRILSIKKQGGCYISGGAGYTTWKYGDVFDDNAVGGFTLSQGVDVILPLRTTVNFIAKKPQQRDMNLHIRLAVDEMYWAAQKKIIPTISLSAGLDFGYRNITKALHQK